MNLIAVVCLAAALSGPATACPLCHTQTGVQVRAALLGQDLWLNVSATVLPFMIFALITGVIYFGPSKAKPPIADSSQTDKDNRQAQ